MFPSLSAFWSEFIFDFPAIRSVDFDDIAVSPPYLQEMTTLGLHDTGVLKPYQHSLGRAAFA